MANSAAVAAMGPRSTIVADAPGTGVPRFVELTSGTVGLLMLFFHFVAAVATVLCFFALVTAFEARGWPADACGWAAGWRDGPMRA